MQHTLLFCSLNCNSVPNQSDNFKQEIIMESVSISVTTCRANFAEIIELFFLFTLISCCLQVITRKVGQMQFHRNYAGTSSQHSNTILEPASETLNSWMVLLVDIKFFAGNYSGSGSSSDDSYPGDLRFYILQILSRCGLCQRWPATPIPGIQGKQSKRGFGGPSAGEVQRCALCSV